MKVAGVYAIVNTVTGMLYIGSGFSIQTRWYGHRNNLSFKRANRHLQAAWNKYGSDNFVWTVLEVLDNPTKEELIAREQFRIDEFQSSDREHGYNIRAKAETNKGCRYGPHSDERKAHISSKLQGKPKPQGFSEKISQLKKGNKNFEGKTHSAETRAKLAQRLNETRQTKAYKQAHAVAQRARFARDGSPRKGAKHTDEARAKMSASMQGRIPWNAGKRKS